MDNPSEIYLRQYLNSAGEIEARETASRRKMTAEERQNKMPDLGWDRALLTEGSVQYYVADVMTDYGIKSINDYIGVQKAVLKKLTEDGFFADGNNVVVNQESGMTVAITKDGIRETLGKGSRFETLPSKLKKLKIATIQQIPELIKSATVRMNNVANYHNPSSDLKYVYLTSMAKIDNKEYEVEIIVRGSREKNKFWMHKILLEAKKEESGLSLRDDQERSHTEVNKTRIPGNNVAHDEEIVKGEIKFSLSPAEKAQRAQEKAEAAIAKAEDAKKAEQESYRKELTRGVKKLFEVQSYDNEALSKLLEAPMAEMQQGLTLLQSEKDDLYEKLLDLGTTVVAPADEYYAEIKNELKGRRIFVPQGIRREMGDDWNAFKKKAFGLRIYLTSEESDRGADVHMLELADKYPDVFTEEYDATEMLRQIVDAAEKGTEERTSLLSPPQPRPSSAPPRYPRCAPP